MKRSININSKKYLKHLQKRNININSKKKNRLLYSDLEVRGNTVYRVLRNVGGDLAPFSSTTYLFSPNSGSENENENENENSEIGENSDNNSPSIDDDGSGYGTDSNRSWFEEGANAMMVHPVREIPEDQLRRYIKDTGEILDDPIEIVDPDEEGATEILQEYSDRHEELKEELNRREREGWTNLPDSDSADSESNTNNNPENASSVNKDSESNTNNNPESASSVNKNSESSTKRKFEDESDSSIQPPKKSKQDNSDITGETEPFDFWGGDD
jgi:hypothetical protein